MIVFITDNPAHETDAEIIRTLKIRTNKFILMSPNVDEIDLQKIALNEENSLFLIKPNHPNIINICKILQKYQKTQFKAINPIFTTLFFKNKWDILNTLKLLLSDKNTPQNIINKFRIPKSWFLLSDPELTEEEKRDFFKELKINFFDKYPLVVKYPINHDGIHFVQIISNYEELIMLEDLIFTSGLIIQESLGTQNEIIKSYCIGDRVFSFKQKELLHSLDNKTDNPMQKSYEIKESKQFMETPEVIDELLKFLKIKYDIILFGVDLIKDNNDLYYIIDINDFPGFRGIKKAGEIIGELVIKFHDS